MRLWQLLLVLFMTVGATFPLKSNQPPVTVSRSLIQCLAQQYDSQPWQVPIDARRWALELLEDGHVTIDCKGSVWDVLLTE